MVEDQEAGTANARSPGIRPYRSKKQRPCDGCRRRRVGCFVPAGQKDCVLCYHRGATCTFESAAPIKKGRPSPPSIPQRPQPAGRPELRASHEVAVSGRPTGESGVHFVDGCPGPTDAETPESCRSTLVPGRTSLYVGSSSDQDVYLLRHLPFDARNTFGNSNWRVWKTFADDVAPAYFTSYPNTLLDASTEIYDLEKIDSVVRPHQSHLLSLYYAYVHPNLPILEDRGSLEESISAGTVPASLVAAVYCAAMGFWQHSPALGRTTPIPKQTLYEFIFTAVTLEARTPTLRTVQAMLLYMQIPPKIVREPNHPGFWALTGQLVALAQDTGLHVDPAGWNTCPSERRTRRILWWAVYMHDKWLAHWLGRPSHIDDRQFSVASLELDDFAIGMAADRAVDSLTQSIAAFVMLTRLTKVLSMVLDSFYTVNRKACVMSPEEALSRASSCQVSLRDCLAKQGSILLHPSRVINDYAFVFAYYGIAVSIQRALFACVGGTSYYDIEKEMALLQDLSDVFEDLLAQEALDGLWLSYCKSNIAVIGSFIITALLSSTDNGVYEARRDALEGFRLQLCRLAERFEFAALPLLRLNLLLERFTENGGTGEEQEV